MSSNGTADEAFIVQLRHSKGTTALQLTRTSSASDFEREAYKVLNAEPGSFRFFYGFPRKRLEDLGDAHLSSAIARNELVIAQKSELEGKQAHSTVPVKVGKAKSRLSLNTLSSPKRRKNIKKGAEQPWSVETGIGNNDAAMGVDDENDLFGHQKQAEALLRAVTSVGEDANGVDANWKKYVGNSLQQRYVEADGERRLASVHSDSLKLEATDDGKRLKVTFPGFSGEHSKTEEVLLVSSFVVTAIVKNIWSDVTNPEAKEMLKPVNLAWKCTWLFWNLIKHHPGKGIEQALEDILPEAPKGFFGRRQRQMSSKALQNAQQKQERVERRDRMKQRISEVKHLPSSTTLRQQDGNMEDEDDPEHEASSPIESSDEDMPSRKRRKSPKAKN